MILWGWLRISFEVAPSRLPKTAEDRFRCGSLSDTYMRRVQACEDILPDSSVSSADMDQAEIPVTEVAGILLPRSKSVALGSG